MQPSSTTIGSGVTNTANAMKHKRLGMNPMPKQSNMYQTADQRGAQNDASRQQMNYDINNEFMDADGGTSSPDREPLNLETRPLQTNDNEEEQKQDQLEEYEEEDSNKVTEELPIVYNQEEQIFRQSLLEQEG